MASCPGLLGAASELLPQAKLSCALSTCKTVMKRLECVLVAASSH